MQIQDELRYSKNHEWVRSQRDGSVTVGISDYAQEALGDVVYVDLPETGRVVAAGEVFAEVESTKSVNDVYAPVAGVITAVNAALVDTPELVNSDPFGAGWMIKLKLADPDEVSSLLSADSYAEHIG